MFAGVAVIALTWWVVLGALAREHFDAGCTIAL